MSVESARHNNERIHLLKRYEQHCYQMAFYLLKCEKKALEATQRSLLELANDHTFLSAPSDIQDMKARKVTMVQSFAVHLQQS